MFKHFVIETIIISNVKAFEEKSVSYLILMKPINSIIYLLH